MLLQSDEERGIRQILSGSINHSVVLVIFACRPRIKTLQNRKETGPEWWWIFFRKETIEFPTEQGPNETDVLVTETLHVCLISGSRISVK